jgi:two-component system LytT family response regulator
MALPLSDPRTTILIVDDESLGRDCVRLAVQASGAYEIVGESDTAEQAVHDILELEPQIVVLDIQMPGKTGFDVIREVGVDRMPPTVFVTAHDAFALQAFEVHAMDYVLKPFDDARLMAALDHVRHTLGERRRDMESLDRLLHNVGGAGERGEATWAKRILVRAADRFRYVPLQEVDWIEASGNLLRLHGRQEVHTVRMTMHEMMDHLDPSLFVRIHRSTIVRLSVVKEFQPWFGGDYLAILNDGKQLRVSRTYRERVLKAFH